MAAFLRFSALSALGIAADAVILSVALSTGLGAFGACAIGLVASLLITMAGSRFIDPCEGESLSIGRAGLWAIFVIAALLNYAVFSALLVTLPTLQPLAAMALATCASTIFGLFGFFRFAFRES